MPAGIVILEIGPTLVEDVLMPTFVPEADMMLDRGSVFARLLDDDEDLGALSVVEGMLELRPVFEPDELDPVLELAKELEDDGELKIRFLLERLLDTRLAMELAALDLVSLSARVLEGDGVGVDTRFVVELLLNARLALDTNVLGPTSRLEEDNAVDI